LIAKIAACILNAEEAVQHVKNTSVHLRLPFRSSKGSCFKQQGALS